MAEKPEQVLPQVGRAPGLGVEKVGAEVPVEPEHDEGSGQRRHREENLDVGPERHPGVKRNLAQAHSGAAEREHRRDQIDRAATLPMPLTKRPSIQKSVAARVRRRVRSRGHRQTSRSWAPRRCKKLK